MGDIVAPDGSPLAAALISVANLQTSLDFYEGVLGLQRTALGDQDELDSGFLEHWHLPRDTRFNYCVLQGGQDPVGQIQLFEFEVPSRRPVRTGELSRAFGLFNLNFYTDDIRAVFEQLEQQGFEFWSEPVRHDFGEDVGSPIEVVFEGPDGVPINLVELATTDPNTRIGQMRAFVESYGKTASGFTPVVTTSHGVEDLEAAQRFYRDVLHMRPLIDDELGSPDANRFLRLAPDARTRVVFMQGNHMFGKVVLADALNYECENVRDRAYPPNIGYVAQVFEVLDLDKAAWSCAKIGAEVYSPVNQVPVPGRGDSLRPSMIVRNPGSGALQQLIQADKIAG